MATVKMPVLINENEQSYKFQRRMWTLIGYMRGPHKTSEVTDTRLFSGSLPSLLMTVRDDGLVRYLVRGQYYSDLTVAARMAGA